MRLLSGAQDTLPSIGQLPAILAEKDSYLVLDSETCSQPSTFSVYRCPGPFSDLDLAFYPIEAAIRHIAYLIAKIPSRGDASMGSAIPDTESKTVLCADNFDEIRHHPAPQGDCCGGSRDSIAEPPEVHRNLQGQGRQLCGALTGALQGGEMLGEARVLRHSCIREDDCAHFARAWYAHTGHSSRVQSAALRGEGCIGSGFCTRSFTNSTGPGYSSCRGVERTRCYPSRWWMR